MPTRHAAEAPIVAADALVLHRAGRAVLDGASLALVAGSVHALTAPSGAGKSTLLRCLVRLEEPESGSVLLRGEDIRQLPAPSVRRRVAFVAQAPVMLPGTVGDNLAYGVADLSDERRDAALAACALEPEFLARDARELSGGERARVAIARALTREPEALLFDEPTAALDAPVAARLAETIRELAATGRAVLVATHDAALVEALGGGAFELSGGHVRELAA